MKNIYLAINAKEKETGKLFAYAAAVPAYLDLKEVLNSTGIVSALYMETRKKAIETAKVWNRGYFDNGEFAFGKLYNSEYVRQF